MGVAKERSAQDEAMTFIAKPRSGARGVGIFLFQAPREHALKCNKLAF